MDFLTSDRDPFHSVRGGTFKSNLIACNFSSCQQPYTSLTAVSRSKIFWLEYKLNLWQAVVCKYLCNPCMYYLKSYKYYNRSKHHSFLKPTLDLRFTSSKLIQIKMTQNINDWHNTYKCLNISCKDILQLYAYHHQNVEAKDGNLIKKTQNSLMAIIER